MIASSIDSVFSGLSFVVPCYNEEATLPLFYQEITAMLADANITDFILDNVHAKAIVEFIFVDDGSSDNTLNILKHLATQDCRVHYISFSRNFGKEAAMLAGLRATSGQYVVMLDADLQDPPSFIPQMLKAVSSGEFDCAGTRRVTRSGEPLIRSFFARQFYRIMAKVTEVEVVDGARDFRLMNRQYVEAIISLQERNRFSKGIFPWVGFKTKWFEYENIQRVAGSTKWSFGKLLLYSLDGIIAFSTKPLAIASITGILLFLIALVFIGIIVIRRTVWGDPVDGWASTTCIILFCSGIQLFTTGILGAYLSKTYTEIKQRPHYIIKNKQ